MAQSGSESSSAPAARPPSVLERLQTVALYVTPFATVFALLAAVLAFTGVGLLWFVDQRIEVRFSQLDSRFVQIDSRFAHIEARLDTMATKDDIQRVVDLIEDVRREGAEDRRALAERVSALEGQTR